MTMAGWHHLALPKSMWIHEQFVAAQKLVCTVRSRRKKRKERKKKEKRGRGKKDEEERRSKSYDLGAVRIGFLTSSIGVRERGRERGKEREKREERERERERKGRQRN